MRGQASKQSVEAVLLQTFPGAFKYDKEIRVPMVEDGAEVQIKITLTAAKTNVACGGDTAVPGAVPTDKVAAPVGTPSIVDIKPTEEEQERVKALMESLNL